MQELEFLSRRKVYNPTPQTFGLVCDVICFDQWNVNQSLVSKCNSQ